MTQFEQELIRVIEYGCPFCGEDRFLFYSTEHPCYRPWNQDGWLYLEFVDNSEDALHIELVCVGCEGFVRLWTAEGGWIPELKEIVKGE